MADPATWMAVAAVATAATGAASAGYQMHSGEKAADAAKKQFESEQGMQAQQLASAEQMAEQERAEYGAAMQRDQSRRRQMMAAGQSGGGRYGTILTNQGTYAGAGGGAGTLLGG